MVTTERTTRVQDTGERSGITVEVIPRDDLRYDAVCEKARETYKKILRVSLISFPPIFVALFDNEVPIASVGVWRGIEIPIFLTERYCKGAGVNPEDLRPNGKVVVREECAEACCLNVDRSYGRDYMLLLLYQLWTYAHASGIPFLYVTTNRMLTRPFRQLGAELVYLCNADIDATGYSPRERSEWSQVYFRLEPKCSLIDVAQVFHAAKERAQAGELFPEFRLGSRMVSVINAAHLQ